MSYGNSVSMQMPSICASCGEAPPTTHYNTSSSHQSLIGLFLAKIIGGKKKSTIYYSVPVCTSCGDKLKSRKTTGRIIMAVGGAIAVIGLLTLLPYFTSMANPTIPTTNEEAMAFATNYQQFIPSGIMTIVGMLIAFLGSSFSQRSFAKWNGKLFRFHNDAFHAAFANLNPSIVRKV